MSQNINPDVTLDFHGLICPHPIVEAKKILDKMEAGKVMKMVSNCSGTKGDIESWVNRTGNEFLEEEDLGEGDTAFFIKKG